MAWEWRRDNARVIWTGSDEGGLGHNPPRSVHDDSCCGSEPTARRETVRAGEWLYVTQVHTAGVLHAVDYGQQGAEADASVTSQPNLTLAIATADCAPIALVGDNGTVGAVHAGWPGLQAGVVQAAVDAMRDMGATSVQAALGPCIHTECYEFLGPQLDWFVDRWGNEMQDVSSNGTRALNMVTGVSAALAEVDVDLVHVVDVCTACSGRSFSYRATKTDQRQVMLVWRDS